MKLLILGIVLVFAVLVPLTYEPLYNYSTYYIPIKNVKLYEIESLFHIDHIKISQDLDKMSVPLERMQYNEHGNSLDVIFTGGHNEVYPGIPSFDYELNVKQNQTFVFRCVENSTNTFLGFYKFLGTQMIYGDNHILLWHYEGETKRPMTCNYPEIIINSIDLVDSHPTEEYMINFNDRFDIDSIVERNAKIE
jgi:hypothetical protein